MNLFIKIFSFIHSFISMHIEYISKTFIFSVQEHNKHFFHLFLIAFIKYEGQRILKLFRHTKISFFLVVGPLRVGSGLNPLNHYAN